MRRVSVVGNSGSGKSTLSARLAARLAAPHVELDAVFHQPGWVPLPDPEFRARVAELTAGHAWVVDGNYSAVRELVWERADTVIWLDLPRGTATRRVLCRTVRRAARRAELWNGNRERWANLLSLDPDTSVIAWSWRKHRSYRERYATAMADPRWAGLRFVRLRSRREVARLLHAELLQ